ncbi:LAGLIDADG family homing endonuclease [Nitrococcus mobilis]|nr:LAGLIDADG family homing endonuclease [Nitrococcus mobilis]
MAKAAQAGVAPETVADIPLQPASQDIWDTKYRLKTKAGQILDETLGATFQRVARALADIEQTPEQRAQWYEKFIWALRHGAIPAGRIISNAGAWAHKPATSTINCTVSATIEDSMDDILGKVHEAGLTLKAGCVAATSRVVTEHGVVSAARAVRERHARMLCYDRERKRFEMRRIERHMTTHVPRQENIEIVSNAAALKTSIRHPVLIYRQNRLRYVRADEVRQSDALVHYGFSWTAEQTSALQAWHAGVRLARGRGVRSCSAQSLPPPLVRFRLPWAQITATRLFFKLRAGGRDLIKRDWELVGAFWAQSPQMAVVDTPPDTPAWNYPIAAFEAEATEAADGDDGPVGKARGAQLPEWVAAQPQKYFLPFLAGLIEACGTVSGECGSVALVLSSPALAERLIGLLGLFGVRGVIMPRAHHGGRVFQPARAEPAPDGVLLKITDTAFLARVASYMAAGGTRERIIEHCSQAGQYDHYVLPGELAEALERKDAVLNRTERQALGFYHGYHRRAVVSRIWLERWSACFPELGALIAFARTLRPVDAIRRGLDIAETFYDFTVEKHSNYLAGENGLMVIHNCGIGYEFSTLRPKGAYVCGAGAYTSGPLSFMDIYDKMCFTVSSAGGRRGAQMATFDVGHPDVLDFIRAKREAGRLRQFNLSLLITDEFMKAVERGTDWPLAFPLSAQEASVDGIDLDDPEQVVWREWPSPQTYVTRKDGLVACRIFRRIKAQRIWDMIMTATYDYAEPGFILIDRVNELNNNWFCEEIRATNPCVTADTRLHTQHGLVPIGELQAAGVPIEATVDKRALGAGRGTVARAAKPAFMTARQADVYRVVTEDGYEIKATEWHDFYTERGKIKLRDLKAGDRLLVQSGRGQFGVEGSLELGKLLGLITGDGHFTNRGSGKEAVVINFWGQERSLADAVAGYVNSLIAEVAVTERHYRVAAVAVPQRQQVFIRSILLARVLAHYGFTRHSKLRVPEVIWRGSQECVKAYLQGLFQTDGTVNISSKSLSCSIRLASSHPSLLKDVQMLLANFGVFCRLRARRKAGSRRLPDGRGGSREYECRADHELIIDGESREVFMREIGFLLDYKNARYRQWSKGRVLRKTQRFASRIASITYAGREPVYDTTQSDKNTVIFNGLVTGQCGEQPLPEFGACLLGSVNLTKFVREPFTERAWFDWEEYRRVVAIFTRMLDNVVEINGLPLERQREEILRKRRHGMGFLGLGSALTMLRMQYGAPDSLAFTERAAKEMALAGWRAGLELAEEKGPAPIMDEEFTLTEALLAKRPEMRKDGYRVGQKVKGRVLWARYSRYMQRIAEADPELVERLAEQGARFTHHSSIAPTGTISLSLANNASNGIEPSFAHHYFRNVIRAGRKSKEKIDVYSFELLAYRHFVDPQALPSMDPQTRNLPDYFITADDITPQQHVDIQAAAQKWIDSSISKTANVPTDYPYEDFKGIYRYAYQQGLKGCTTFRFNPEAFQGVLVKEQDLASTTYRFQLEDGQVIEAKGGDEIEYDGEIHTAANLYDALKEGYYGKW